MNYLIIAGSTIGVYLFIIIALRVFGKKELSQLSVLDLVFILLLSNSVQNAMVGANTSLLGGLCAATALFFANAILKYLVHKSPKLSNIVQGSAVILIYHGEIINENLKKVGVTIVELEEVVREHGVPAITDVDLAMLEIDGSISVLSQDYSKVSRRKRTQDKETI